MRAFGLMLSLLVCGAAAQQDRHVGRAATAPTAAQVAAARDALTRARAEHGPDSEPSATSALALARVLFGSGALAEAEQHALAAARILEILSPDGSLPLADALLVAGACQANVRRHGEAAGNYERCLRMRERLLGPAEPRTMLALQNLYGSRASSGDTVGALDSLRTLLTRLEQHHRSHPATQTIRREFVYVSESIGNYTDALAVARRCLAESERSNGDALATARDRFQVGQLLCRLLQFEEGLAALDAVVTELEDLEVDAGERFHFLAVRATLAMAAQRPDAARLGAEALALATAFEEIADKNCAAMLTQAAVMFAEPAQALTLARRGAAACQRLFGAEDLNTAAALSNLAQVETSNGDLDAAIEHASAAIAAFEKHSDSMTPNRFTARTTLAVCLVRSLRAAEALPYLQRNLDELPRLLHAALPILSDTERMDYAAGARIALDLMLHTAVAGQASPDDALRGVLAYKGVVARGLHQELRWLRDQAGDGPRLQAELARLGRDLLSERAGKELDLAAYASRREALNTRLQELDRSNAPPGPKSVADLMGADEAYVDFALYADWGGVHERLCALVVAGGRTHLVDLGPVAPILQALQAHIELASRSMRPGDAIARSLATKAAQRLARLVWAPLAATVGNRTRVTLCLDGALAALPFATLQGDDGQFLLERHEFVHVGAGSDLFLPPVRHDGAPRLAVVGDVDFGAAGASPGPSRAGFAPLAHSLGEIDAVVGVFRSAHGAAAEVDRLVGARATADGFAAIAAAASHLHIATHGYYQGSSALRLESGDMATRGRFGLNGRSALSAAAGRTPERLAGIALAGANVASDGGDRDDGLLTAAEIAWLDLRRCDLVVLSACETGLGTPSAGDSLVGLRRSLRLAGARRSLTTAWRIDDRATAALMATFYRELWNAKVLPATALRTAQLAALARNRELHGDPLVATWGAFVLEGR